VPNREPIGIVQAQAATNSTRRADASLIWVKASRGRRPNSPRAGLTPSPRRPMPSTETLKNTGANALAAIAFG